MSRPPRAAVVARLYRGRVAQLRPDSTAAHAVAALSEASRGARDILGAGLVPVDRLSRYRIWSSQQVCALSAHLTPSSMNDLVTTQRHWLLLSLDTKSLGGPEVGELVDLEINDRIAALDDAASEVRARAGAWSEWRGPNLDASPRPAVVLDTNVLLRHSHELVELPWSQGLEVFPHVPITLGIPIAVVEELDKLRHKNDFMYTGDDRVPVRDLAGRALKELDRMFQSGYLNWQIRERRSEGSQLLSELHAALMVDDLTHARLPEPDAEIIDQTLRLKPYTAKVVLATYDRAMAFRAQAAGLKTFRPAVID